MVKGTIFRPFGQSLKEYLILIIETKVINTEIDFKNNKKISKKRYISFFQK